jgi:peroxiredoxin Q/BCP
MTGMNSFKCIAFSGMFLLLATASAHAADLAVGDRAPGFTLTGTDGNSYSLAQFEGKRGVVLAWFPKASTPG